MNPQFLGLFHLMPFKSINFKNNVHISTAVKSLQANQ